MNTHTFNVYFNPWVYLKTNLFVVQVCGKADTVHSYIDCVCHRHCHPFSVAVKPGDSSRAWSAVGVGADAVFGVNKWRRGSVVWSTVVPVLRAVWSWTRIRSDSRLSANTDVSLDFLKAFFIRWTVISPGSQ